ncbi:hypothetical protein BGZ94_006654 [Podila epigama]|nr:hypothetical protein BGZ94_006654 [Podila epigama]
MPEPVQNETIWYLAYGSNMDPKVFTGRRKINPLESVPVIVPDYWLSFDIAGIPFLEPCFASIIKIDHSRIHDRAYALEIHSRTQYAREFKWDEKHPERSFPPVLQGVAHRITLRDWQRVIESEGGWGHDVPTGYNQIMVRCNILDKALSMPANGSTTIEAHVLEARPVSIKANCQPTARYKNLLTAGAAHHHLDPAYQRYLAEIVPYECNGWRSKIARVLFLALSTPTLLFFAALVLHNRGKPEEKADRPPFWVAWTFDKLGRMSTLIHDYAIMPLFGSGRCSTTAHQELMRKRIAERLKEHPSLEEQQACREEEDEHDHTKAAKAVHDVVESAAE